KMLYTAQYLFARFIFAYIIIIFEKTYRSSILKNNVATRMRNMLLLSAPTSTLGGGNMHLCRYTFFKNFPISIIPSTILTIFGISPPRVLDRPLGDRIRITNKEIDMHFKKRKRIGKY